MPQIRKEARHKLRIKQLLKCFAYYSQNQAWDKPTTYGVTITTLKPIRYPLDIDLKPIFPNEDHRLKPETENWQKPNKNFLFKNILLSIDLQSKTLLDPSFLQISVIGFSKPME
jgi:hypothetical protein